MGQSASSKKGTNKRIYLDYAAATPVRAEIKVLTSELLDMYANPSSIHRDGVDVRARIESARKRAAIVLGALSEEVRFTSGSTEGLNIAIQGVIASAQENFKAPHVITSAIEHPAILETLKELEKRGVRVDYLVPHKSGIVDPVEIRNVLKEETVLVALSLVESELGTLLPVKEYVKEVRRFRQNVTGRNYPYFLLDATQAPLHYNLNVQKLSADLLVLDGGKLGGLKGSGLLYIRRSLNVTPTMFGGGQERGLRPGTENILGIETLVSALESVQKDVSSMLPHVSNLSSFFIEKLRIAIPSAHVNGDEAHRAPHIVSVCFPGIDAEWLVLGLDAQGISVSRGSACKSGKGNESEVLRVINPACKEHSIRFSFGKETTYEELTRAVEVLKKLTHT